MAEPSAAVLWATWALAVALGVGACSTDTSGLELRPPASAGAPSGGGAGGGTLPDGEPELPPGPIDVPPSDAPPRVTLLHGLVDGGELWSCRGSAAAELPWPASGIAYAAGATLTADWDVATETVELRLFAARAEQITGLDCAALETATAPVPSVPATDAGASDGDAGAPLDDGGPAAVRRARRVVLPPGTLEPGQHYLLVVAGCSDGRGEPAADVCGSVDPLSGDALSVSLVALGSQDVDEGEFLTLQFINASRAVGPVEVVLQGTSEHDVTVTLAEGASFGALVPRRPATVRAPAGVELRAAQTSSAALVQAWSDITVAGAGPAEFGKGYVLAYVGPAPSVSATLGFARSRFVLLESE